MPNEVRDLNAALQEQPGHFWATCLLSICQLQANEQLQAWVGSERMP